MKDAAEKSGGGDARFGFLDDMVGYHLRRASGVVGGDLTRALGETGVRQILFGILSIVHATPGITQAAVGRMLGIQRANMVAPINELIDRDLLQRQTSTEDRRGFSLTLSVAGQAMYADCRERVRAHEERLLSDLDAAERALLIDLLRRIEAKAQKPGLPRATPFSPTMPAGWRTGRSIRQAPG